MNNRFLIWLPVLVVAACPAMSCSSGDGSGLSPATGGSSGEADGGGVDTGGGVGGQTCTTGGMPATIQSMLTSKCVACHGATSLPGAPPLVTVANLTAPAASDPTKTNAVVALERIQSTTVTAMPPVGGTRATAAEVTALETWIAAGYSAAACSVSPPDGGTGDAGAAVDPFSLPPTCTSKTSWTGGNRGSKAMNPGMACIGCHASGGGGPRFSVAGTLYATGHEPDLCNGASDTTGARVVITAANGAVTTLTLDPSGNFLGLATVALPYHAKVTYSGRERSMISAQTSGDCNSCHTQSGANGAPGRLVLP